MALDKPSWTVSEQLEALKNITEDDFMHYASQLLDKVYLKCLAHGNIDRQKVCFCLCLVFPAIFLNIIIDMSTLRLSVML